MRAIALLFLMLAACDRGPEVPTAAENADLNVAADMLDDAPGNLSNIDENAINAVEPVNSVEPQ
jgi:hypothetical protein